MKNFSLARLFTALVHKLLERSFSCAHFFSLFFFFYWKSMKAFVENANITVKSTERAVGGPLCAC